MKQNEIIEKKCSKFERVRLCKKWKRIQAILLVLWREQFGVSIHSRPVLSDAEKLVYLKDALKDGPTEYVIQGLAQNAGTYDETIECLVNQYDRPRLIHQAHVRAIMDAPSLKKGNGKVRS